MSLLRHRHDRHVAAPTSMPPRPSAAALPRRHSFHHRRIIAATTKAAVSSPAAALLPWLPLPPPPPPPPPSSSAVCSVTVFGYHISRAATTSSVACTVAPPSSSAPSSPLTPPFDARCRLIRRPSRARRRFFRRCPPPLTAVPLHFLAVAPHLALPSQCRPHGAHRPDTAGPAYSAALNEALEAGAGA